MSHGYVCVLGKPKSPGVSEHGARRWDQNQAGPIQLGLLLGELFGSTMCQALLDCLSHFSLYIISHSHSNPKKSVLLDQF